MFDQVFAKLFVTVTRNLWFGGERSGHFNFQHVYLSAILFLNTLANKNGTLGHFGGLVLRHFARSRRV